MPAVSTPAIILQAFPYSETSKILRLLTRDHGLQSVVAKGAFRQKSRFGGILEPFTEGTAAFYARENRDLHTLSGFDLIRSRQSLGFELTRFGGASLIAELVLRTGVEHADPDLFESVRVALNRLEQAAPGSIEPTVLAEAWSLIARIGFAPALEDCLTCGRNPETGEVVLFDYAAGGVHCTDCGTATAGRHIPPEARATLQCFLNGEAPALERTAAHWKLLARYLAHHVLDQAPLRSLEFLAAALANPDAPATRQPNQGQTDS